MKKIILTTSVIFLLNTLFGFEALAPKTKFAITDKNLPENFFSQYVNPGFWDPQAVPAIKKKLKSVIPPDAKIIDLFCGFHTLLPDDYNPKEVIGVGLNPNELKRNKHLTGFIARDLNKNSQVNELPKQSFDMVMMTSGMAYLNDPQKLFSNVLENLKPGGLFFIAFTLAAKEEEELLNWKLKSVKEKTEFTKQALLATGIVENITIDQEEFILNPIIPSFTDRVYFVYGYKKSSNNIEKPQHLISFSV